MSDPRRMSYSEAREEIERLKDQVSELQTINGNHEQLITELADALTSQDAPFICSDHELIQRAREAAR